MSLRTFQRRRWPNKHNTSHHITFQTTRLLLMAIANWPANKLNWDNEAEINLSTFWGAGKATCNLQLATTRWTREIIANEPDAICIAICHLPLNTHTHRHWLIYGYRPTTKRQREATTFACLLSSALLQTFKCFFFLLNVIFANNPGEWIVGCLLVLRLPLT